MEKKKSIDMHTNIATSLLDQIKVQEENNKQRQCYAMILS